jgi:hexosaminidase
MKIFKHILFCIAIVGLFHQLQAQILPEQNTVTVSPLGLIPWPAELIGGTGEFTIDDKTLIVAPSSLYNEALLLAEPLRKATGFPIPIVKPRHSTPVGGTILFVQKKSKNIGFAEGYRLSVTPTLITIEAEKAVGHFYGTRTLLQLFPPQAATGRQEPLGKKIDWTAPCVEIKDWPRFAWRAFMFDESRNFHGLAAVKRYIDEMAALKMNVFHWHLTDNHGWRLEIKRYPKLTSVGAASPGTRLGDVIPPVDTSRTPRYFYTQEEAREVVDYAARRYVRVIPEIEMPGHATAALQAYPEWSAINGFDITKPEVIVAIKNILDEVCSIFPGAVIHTGGDELQYAEWEKTPSIQAAMAAKGLKSSAPLQLEFSTLIARYLRTKDRRMIYWADDLEQITDEKSAILQFWRGDPAVIIEAVKRGNEIVNSEHHFTYLDYNYALLPLEKVYNFDPVPVGLDEKYQNQILGLGGQAWGELMPNQFRSDAQIFPRLAAVAEVGWTLKEKKDFRSFAERLKSQELRWTLSGIHYTPDCERPFAEIRDEVLHGSKFGTWTAAQVDKGLTARYSGDFSNIHEYDVTHFITGAGRYRVSFNPTEGVDVLTVRLVELVENGNPIAVDWAGITGASFKFGKPGNEAYIFDLWVDTIQLGAKYALRISYFGLNGTDTSGDLFIKNTGLLPPAIAQ